MTAEPRVALVHDWLTGMRGGENVLAAIARLYPTAPIFTLFHFPGAISAELESHPIHTAFTQKAPFARSLYRHYLPLFPTAIESLDLQDFDLVISSSHCVAKGVLCSPTALHLCYCHTPMRYAWDQERVYFPKRRGIVARSRALALSRLRVWDVSSTPRVDHFWANSSFVATRIQRFYGRDSEVLHPPVDTDFFCPAASDLPENDTSASPDVSPDRYVLMVSALAPYKRVDLAIRACRRAGIRLVIVGNGPQRRELERIAEGSTTEFAGHLDKEKLRDLYRNALCFLQPGLEDFGIAAVESLACGTPVVALGAGGIEDIVIDGAHGILYRPSAARTDEDYIRTITTAIDKIGDLRFNEDTLATRANRFSSSSFVEQLRSSIARQRRVRQQQSEQTS